MSHTTLRVDAAPVYAVLDALEDLIEEADGYLPPQLASRVRAFAAEPELHIHTRVRGRNVTVVPDARLDVLLRDVRAHVRPWEADR